MRIELNAINTYLLNTKRRGGLNQIISREGWYTYSNLYKEVGT